MWEVQVVSLGFVSREELEVAVALVDQGKWAGYSSMDG